MIRAKTKIPSKDESAKRRPILIGKFLTADPRVCHGELTFRGTRIPVETILLYLAKGCSLNYLRKSWPEVPPEAIQEAISLATDSLVKNYRHKKT
jgi:uncharacterized protein (DUF433 family)